MSGKIADLYAEVGFKFDQVKLREVAKYIGDLNIASIISAGSLAALGEGIKELVQETAALATSLAVIHSSTGVSTEFLQKFENASFELNSSKESADAFITSLSKIKASLLLPGGTVPYGLRLMGFTKEDFQGTLEDNAKMIWTRLSQSKPPANATQAMKEQWRGLLNNVASSFGVSAEQFMAMSNANFGAKFDIAPFLNTDELNQSTEAQTEWRTSVTNLNVEFEKLGIAVIPLINAFSGLLGIVNKWLHNLNDPIVDRTAGGFRKGQGGRHGYISTPQEVSQFNDFWKKFWKADSHPGRSFIPQSQPTIQKPSTVNINVAPMTIQAVDTKDFMNKFDDALTKYLKSTSLQFAQGQT